MEKFFEVAERWSGYALAAALFLAVLGSLVYADFLAPILFGITIPLE